MNVSTAEITLGLALIGAICTAIISTLTLGRKVGRIERDMEVTVAEIAQLKSGALERAVSMAKLEGKVDALTEKIDRVLDSLRDIQRNFPSQGGNHVG